MSDQMDRKPDAEKSTAELANETAEAAETRAAQLKAKAEQMAREAIETGKAEARARVDGVKVGAAEEAKRTAKAMRDAAGRFPEGDLRGVAATQLADGLAHVSDRIREKDLGDIPGDLTAFARRNPGVFFAGAALLGFAVARLAKATAEQKPVADYDDPYRDYEDRGAA